LILNLKIEFGKLIWEIPDLLREFIRKNDNKEFTVTFKRKKTMNPTESQRGYFFASVLPCFQRGYYEQNAEWLSQEQAFLMIKLQCNYKEIVNEKTGEFMRVPLSTSNQNFDIIDEIEFIEKCILFIEEWYDMAVPPPTKKKAKI
jgi:hypothetical protein